MEFTELDLPFPIQKSLKALGMVEMTPIQEATFELISAGRDMVGLAETGSGKTAACVIPLLPRLDPELNAIQVLVIVPTRELCLQYVHQVDDIGKRYGIAAFGVYGGISKTIQVTKLNHEVHFLVATPGRLIDLMYDGDVRLNQVRCVILDEADELLKEGFIEDIEFVLSCIRQDHQTLLFSATMPDDIKKLAHTYLRDPEHITLIAERAAPTSLEHWFQYISPHGKEDAIVEYLNHKDVKQAIIFCNSRNKVDDLHASLQKKIKGIEFIHAGLHQERRNSIFIRFKSNRIHCLVATDVAGRGLDFSHVTHVINWDIPRGQEQYTHRTGRTGRMGRKGVALTFVSKRGLGSLRKLLERKKITPNWIGQDPLHGNAGDSTDSGSRRPRRNQRNRRR
ncbi:DEAD/DEAH box helicase [Planctomycetota bacterium]